jgi:hypothetical protein
MVTRCLRNAPLWGVGLLLLVIAAAKLWPGPHPEHHPSALPQGLLAAIAMVEGVLGGWLLAGGRRLVLWLVILLGLVFLGGLAILTTAQFDIAQCGCFGRLRVGLTGHTTIALCVVLVPACELILAAGAPIQRTPT